MDGVCSTSRILESDHTFSAKGKEEIRAYVRPVDRLTPAKNADTVKGISKETRSAAEGVHT